jgi:hypothetical protein
LDFALHELDWCQDEGCESTRDGACKPEGRKREGLVAVVEACFEEGFAADAFEEEEGGGFEGSADEGGGDAAVEAQDTIAENRLPEAVQRAGVAEGKGVGLGLETDFDSVEGVFDVFSCYACNLLVVSESLVG